jgi:hypothetical protein
MFPVPSDRCRVRPGAITSGMAGGIRPSGRAPPPMRAGGGA